MNVHKEELGNQQSTLSKENENLKIKFSQLLDQF